MSIFPVNSTQLDQQIKSILKLIRITYGSAIDFQEASSQARKLGYHILKQKSDNQTGYYGLAFKSNNYDNIIIVHRGTDTINFFYKFSNSDETLNNKTNLNSLKILIPSIFTDFVDDARIMLETLPLQAQQAHDFVQEIKTEFSDKHTIQVAGHSLGGSLAEFSYINRSNN